MSYSIKQEKAAQALTAFSGPTGGNRGDGHGESAGD
jgi:hypothetical protein